VKATSEGSSDHKYRLLDKAIDSLSGVLSLLIKWGGLVFIAYFAKEAVRALAGEVTSARILLAMLADVTVKETVAYSISALAILYGLRERKLRRDTIEYYSRRVPELERRIDPNRSSSNLTGRGTTRPEDE